jgi:hypothetical protein
VSDPSPPAGPEGFAARLRAAVTGRAHVYAPGGDLPARIRARVRRRRRQDLAVRGGAVAGVLAVVALAAGLAVAGGSGGGDTLETADPGLTTTTAAAPGDPPAPTPPSSAAVAPPDTAGTSETGATTTTTAEAAETEPPATEPTASSTTTTASDTVPADSELPAAAACGLASGAVAEVVVMPDVPSPRCVEVGPVQSLRVRNDSGQAVDVTFAGASATVPDGGTQAFPRPFGEYLEPGVHVVAVSLYGGSGPEVWFTP